MEKRYYKRLSSIKDIILFSDNSIHSGRLINCSANGMYIETVISFPLDALLKILIPFREEMVKVPVKVVRREKIGDIFSQGIGVKPLNLTKEYLEFIIKINLGS
jgi:hypothetical protein